MTNNVEFTNYDDLSIERYMEHVESPNSWNSLYERPAIIERLPPLKNKNVLDAGCASGFFTGYALKHGARVTAVDISQKMLDRLANKNKSDKLKLYRADLSQPMPFLKNNSFDCIISSMVMHYSKEWEGILAEFYRVMKKGGRLVISTLHPFATYLFQKPPSYFDFKLTEVAWTDKDQHSLKMHYYVRPLHEVLRPIIQSGFKIISVDEPLPSKECKKIDPETYKRLMKEPGFLFIVLEK